jgi:uncharacterized protein
MILVDAGYLVASAKVRDQLHYRAVAWSAAIDEPLVVTEYVLVETVNLLSSPGDRPKAHRVVARACAGSPWLYLPASEQLFQTGLALHRQHRDKAWSLIDCISFAVMRERGIDRAPAHDHHFQQAGFDALLRRDPP